MRAHAQHMVKTTAGCPTADALRASAQSCPASIAAARTITANAISGTATFEPGALPDLVPGVLSGKVPDGTADLRFLKLVGAADWARLPASVRQRFCKRLDPSDVALYKGVVTEMTMTLPGWLLAQALRIVGGPLPVSLKALGRPSSRSLRMRPLAVRPGSEPTARLALSRRWCIPPSGSAARRGLRNMSAMASA